MATSLLEVVGPALLLGPQLGVVRLGVRLELNLVGVDDLLAAVLALDGVSAVTVNQYKGTGGKLTMDVGLGALTGRPLGLTATRVPAFSAALCSRCTWGDG